jgi:uncharacterized membrane protein
MNFGAHFIKQYSKKLSVRAAFFALAALFIIFLAVLMDSIVPKEAAELLGNDAVHRILEIISSSMLVVVTFSLSIMVSAYSSASKDVTPRAAKILMEDRQSQNTISIFLGSFIFGVVSIAGLSTGLFGNGGRFILFIFTVLLLFLIVVTILSWIENLSKLGRVHETVLRIEASALKVLKKISENENYGCRPLEKIPQNAVELNSDSMGYVQNIDFKGLSEIAKENKIEVFIDIGVGSYVTSSRALLHVVGDGPTIDSKLKKELLNCFIIGNSRSYDYDPRFHFVVLSEVASKALSPAVNDPGTAIEVIRSMTQIFSKLLERKEQSACDYANIYFKRLQLKDCLDDIVKPISRDGATNMEVLSQLLKAMSFLKDCANEEESRVLEQFRVMVLERGLQCLKFEEDKESLRTLI